MLTTANQFAMQLQTIKSAYNSIPQETVDYLKSAGRALTWLGGIAATCYAVTRAIQYYYADEIVEEVMHDAHHRITLKKINTGRNENNDYVAEIKNIHGKQVIGIITYAIPNDHLFPNASLYPYIHLIRIEKEYRRKSYGSILLKFALNKIATSNCKIKTVYLYAQPHCLSDNETREEMLPKLIEFYKKHGATLKLLGLQSATMAFELKT